MSPSTIDITPQFRAYPHLQTTRHVVLERGLTSRSAGLLTSILPGNRWVLVADCTTWPLVGPTLASDLEYSGINTTRHIIDAPHPIASDQAVAALQSNIDATSALLAIGSGTINDIAKMAAHRANIPYAIFATAPSMNGYTSSIAALLVDGIKTTQPCTPALACFADLELLAQAPQRMIGAGFADLLSKPVSNADWLLAHHLKGDTYLSAAADLIGESAHLLEGLAPMLPTRDPTAMGKLIASLCLSGLAMSIAGSSAPASGGEHLISHYLDMTHHALGEPNDLHGCQVGVATLSTAMLYEKLLSLDLRTIAIEDLANRHQSWMEYQSIVQQRFGPLAPAVLPHAAAGYPSKSELRSRLSLLQADWDRLRTELRSILRPPEAIREELAAAQCPTSFAQIGISPERARRAIGHSKDIRPRYTILHLIAELGLTDEWTADLSRLI